ncbi:MAG: hypothetical protein EHM41_09840 [Chloroflexi bacterium]|nr:MAG: hypothetical protein EHM41_09840 [Chloroflexota bacterium]
MAYKESEIRNFIVKLRSRASKIDRTAEKIEDLQVADSLKSSADSLEDWLEEKMPGEIPVDLVALLPEEFIPFDYHQNLSSFPVFQTEPAASPGAREPSDITILPIIQKIESSFAVSFQAGIAYLEGITTEQLQHPEVTALLTRLVQQNLVSLNYDVAHALASRCLKEDPENTSLLNLLLISKNLSDARNFWKKGDYGGCKDCTADVKMLQDGYLFLTCLLQWFFTEAEKEQDCFKGNRVLKLFSRDDPNLPEYLQRAHKTRETTFNLVGKIFKDSHTAGMEQLKKFQSEHPDDTDILRLAEKQAEEYLEAMDTEHAREVAEAVRLDSLIDLVAALDEVKAAFEKRDPAGLKAGALKANELQARYQVERR